MKRLAVPFFFFFFAACAIDADSGEEIDPEFTQADQQAWDSEEHNPTHATHSYLTEAALGAVAARYPEAWSHRLLLIAGANTELHELPVSDPVLEQLRRDVEGTNAGCRHPERLWSRVQSSYRAGDRDTAYFLLGILLHYVEDMGVPAHALGVAHQGTFAEHDNFELMGLMRWAPDYSSVNRTRPWSTSPDAFVAWSGAWARDDFASAFPGQAYRRDFFPSTWLFARKKFTTFVKQREGRTAVATYWALDGALYLLARL